MGEGDFRISSAGASDSRTGGGSPANDDLTRRVSRELAEIGLSEVAPWISSIVLYGSGGTIVLALALLSPGSVSRFIQGLAVLALAAAAFSFWGLRSKRDFGWATPVRVMTGIAIITAGGISNGRVAAALGMLLIFPMVSPAYLYSARRAVPFMFIGTAALVSMLMIGHANPWYITQAIASAAMMLTLVTSVIMSQARLRMLIRHHYNRSITDPLTGVANTRRLRERLAAEIDNADRSGAPFALFAIDLDNFKRVNDEFDHRKGDEVLVAVADAIRGETGPDDIVVRRGGDEFSVLVPSIDGRDLDELAARIRAAIVAARRGVCPRITPSGSVGYVLSRPDDTPETVVQRADEELHHRKVRFHAESGDGRRDRARDTVTDITCRRTASTAVERERSETGSAVLRSIGQRWFIVACVALELAVLLPAVSLIGNTGDLGFAESSVLGAASLTVALALFLTGRLRLGDWSLYATFLALGALVTAAVVLAGPAGVALLDLYLIFGLIGFFVFGPRVAAAWLLVMFAAMTTVVLVEHLPYAGLHLGASIAVAVVVASLFAKIRKLTVKYMERHVELAQIDPLTGLANRRLLQARLTDRLEGSDEPDSQVVMIAIDLDEFKLVNDRHSHSFGDRLLREVAEAIRSNTRPDDLVARRGGDEFYVVCETAVVGVAAAAGERLRDAIERARLRLCPDMNPSATIVTVASEPGDDAQAMLYRADVALHAGKLITHAAHGPHGRHLGHTA